MYMLITSKVALTLPVQILEGFLFFEVAKTSLCLLCQAS